MYYVIAPAECSSNLSRFDGVRYGHRAKRVCRPDRHDQEVARRRFRAEPAPHPDRHLRAARLLRRLLHQGAEGARIIADEFTRAFTECDVIAGPVTTSVAFNFGEKAADPVWKCISPTFTPSRQPGRPAGMSIPCGFGERDLPVGLQLTANYFEEAKLLGVAHRYQQATDWHRWLPRGL